MTSPVINVQGFKFTRPTLAQMLFGNSEKGIAKLDYSDFTGMWQDRARTIPYTAVEQPLGSFTGLNGVIATAPADVNRGVVSARVNLLMKTEDFADAAWTVGKTAGASAASNTTIAPNGELTADTVTLAAPSDYLYQPISSFNAVAGSSIVLKYCSKVTGRLIAFGGATPAGADVHIYIDIGGGWYEHKTTRTFSVSVTGTVQVLPQGTIVGAGSFALWGASLTLGTDAHLPYQRVNTATDYDTAGFPHYLKFNGTNTTYVTPSIDFTGTDKMTVWAGVGTDISGATGYLLNHNFTGANSFRLGVPAPAGTINSVVVENSPSFVSISKSGLAGNLRSVISASHRSGEHLLRLDGVLVSSETNATTGPYGGNSSLYIGVLGTGSSFFNGKIYSLIVRGAQSSLSQIEAVENLIRKTMRLP